MSNTTLSKTKCLLANLIDISKAVYPVTAGIFIRNYADEPGGDKPIRMAYSDIKDPGDPECPKPCDRRGKSRPGILHRIKLKIIEGGTNFGTPFRRIDPCPKPVCVEPTPPEQKALPEPQRQVPPMPEARPGVQISILGADTGIGQYVALMLKQCPFVKKLRLYEAKDTSCDCNRNMCNVASDLQHIDTNCLVQAFSFHQYGLERCLQNSDIVLMLESSYSNVDMPFERRFCYNAPIVKRYADAINQECPKAFIIVCTSPIDCMVPLVAETLKENGWYDPRRLMGSMAVPEMRASTLGARAVGLDPNYTRVPCVCGTEGESLVPLFSKTVEQFDFPEHCASMMTDTIRMASYHLSTSPACIRAADLSEAHALSGLVTNVCHALLCHDIPRVSGFVETDAGQIISPAKFIATKVELNGVGISKLIELPKMSDPEVMLVNFGLIELSYKLAMVYDWYNKYQSCSPRLDSYCTQFFRPRPYQRFDDCAYGHM